MVYINLYIYECKTYSKEHTPHQLLIAGMVGTELSEQLRGGEKVMAHQGGSWPRTVKVLVGLRRLSNLARAANGGWRLIVIRGAEVGVMGHL